MPENKPALNQGELARRFKQRILRGHFVRLHMGLILCATTAAGVLTSKLLLELGLTRVLIRYPLAVLGAYAVFVALTKLWVVWVTGASALAFAASRPGSPGHGAGIDPSGLLDVSGSSGGGGPTVSFGGGDAGGAGASDTWDASSSASGGGGGGSSLSSGINLDVDLDDGIWILVALAALIGVILGSGVYLIWAAPNILPDLAVNALMASYITGAARRAETQGWLTGVLRSTWIPFLLVMLVTFGLAFAVHRRCPHAPRLMDAVGCRPELSK